MSVEFTPAEKRTILLTAEGNQTAHVIGYYGAVLLPILAFGIWGMTHDAPDATNIAFLSAFGFHLYQAWYGHSGSSSWQSISRKLADSWTRPASPAASVPPQT